MGDDEQQQFLTAVEKACRIAKVFNDHGVRKYGVIRIDSATGPEAWPRTSRQVQLGSPRPVKPPKSLPITATPCCGSEICWAGMHSWKDMLDLLEAVGMPESLGFQCDLATPIFT